MKFNLQIQISLTISSIMNYIEGRSIGQDDISIEPIVNFNIIILKLIALLNNNMLHFSHFPDRLMISYILYIYIYIYIYIYYI